MSTKDKIIKYGQETQLEMKKVAWPTRDEMVGSTIATIVMSVVVGTFIWFADIGISKAVIAMFRFLG
jgi:preprotein translocase subunit SecE